MNSTQLEAINRQIMNRSVASVQWERIQALLAVVKMDKAEREMLQEALTGYRQSVNSMTEIEQEQEMDLIDLHIAGEL